MKRVHFSHWRRKTIEVAVLAVVSGLAAWALSSRSVAQSSAGQVRTTSTMIDRAPTWHHDPDPYDAFSGNVAVDTVRNEIVVQSPRKLLVYDRQANTPPAATLTEPKRMIAGPKTQMSDNCGLYVDSENGEIYTISNDISDLMTVYGPGAKGDVEPVRKLITPQTVYGLAVDDESHELFMAIGHPPAVFAFSKAAKGNNPAKRILEGSHTKLAYPHGVTVDSKNQLMYVVNNGAVADSQDGLAWRRWPITIPGSPDPLWGVPCNRTPGIDCEYGGEWYRKFEGNVYKFVGRATVIPGSGRFDPPSITVYPLKANGDVAPIRVIQGPKSQLNWPMNLTVDSEHGEFFVANAGGSSVTVYRSTDNGDVAPVRTLKGPRTGLKNPVGIYIDNKNDELVVSDVRTHAASVFRRTADGDTPPLRVIRSGPVGVDAPALGRVTGISYDSKRDQILAPN
jgi:DNA-binding beta-propeller fold protein YncE